MECINLKRRFGRRYRVTYEESYWAEYGPGARVEDPWLMIIPCKWGEILPWGEATLAVSVDGYPRVTGRMRRLKCCQIVQDGDFGELTVTFDMADFDKVAKIMRPRRRRQVNLTPEQRQEIGRRLGESRKKALQTMVQSDSVAHTHASETQDDPRVAQQQLASFEAPGERQMK